MSTKSLNEQVSDVMNERSTKNAKRTKLVKLGLMPHEVELLLSMQRTAKHSGTDFDFSKLTFGVEIESYHYTRESLISAGTANGLQVRSEGSTTTRATSKSFLIRLCRAITPTK